MGYTINKDEQEGRATWWEVISEDGEIVSRHRARHTAESVVKAEKRLRERLVGKRICVQSPMTVDGEPAKVCSYFIEPGGAALKRSDFTSLETRNLIRPVGDALFPGMTQTYELAE